MHDFHRYLTVERPGERKILTICEVEVLGESAEAVAVRNGSVAKVPFHSSQSPARVAPPKGTDPPHLHRWSI